MVFSPGQNGKGGEKIEQIGKLKKNCFFKRKGQSRDKTRPAFTKETTIIPRNQTRKKTHHHTPRSPQKKRQETVSPSTIAEPLPSDTLVAVSPIATFVFCQSCCTRINAPRIAEYERYK